MLQNLGIPSDLKKKSVCPLASLKSLTTLKPNETRATRTLGKTIHEIRYEKRKEIRVIKVE